MSPKLSLVTRTVPEYELDKKTGVVTMPDGKQFNPYSNENVAGLSLDELKVYNQERPPASALGNTTHDDELEMLAEAALEAQQVVKDAEAKAKSATAAFRAALDAAGKLQANTHAVGIVRTTIYPTKRFDEETARGILTKKLAKECEKTVLDSALVKAKVSPEQYESMQVVSGMTLKLSINKTEA